MHGLQLHVACTRASAMQTQARAEVLQLAAIETKDRGGEAKPPGCGDDAQEEPATTMAPSLTMPTSASPRKAQSAWLHASLQSDEENTSTPAWPLFDPPSAQTLYDPRGGDLRVGLPPRPQRTVRLEVDQPAPARRT